MYVNYLLHNKNARISEGMVEDIIEEIRKLLNQLSRSFGLNVKEIKQQLCQVYEYNGELSHKNIVLLQYFC